MKNLEDLEKFINSELTSKINKSFISKKNYLDRNLVKIKHSYSFIESIFSQLYMSFLNSTTSFDSILLNISINNDILELKDDLNENNNLDIPSNNLDIPSNNLDIDDFN